MLECVYKCMIRTVNRILALPAHEHTHTDDDDNDEDQAGQTCQNGY